MERTYKRNTPQPCRQCGGETWCDQGICYKCYDGPSVSGRQMGLRLPYQQDGNRKIEKVDGFTVITEPAS